ncbi:Ig-like domain-containing protein [Paenibacillus sp. 32352]|uniref:Ig-like domain-containing protein n=1 Tax=Paenibacillus sp. 32352 TaxID=1969111 RepID=UPI0009AC86D3|nr:Ig-like domain-containing protein [Paenibacillus sp. 32352]
MKNVFRKSTFMLAIALTLQVVMGSFFMQIAFASPPVLTTSPGSASFVAGDNTTSTPVVIDSGITVTDGSSTTLASATVAIQNGFHGGEDFLGFTNDGATMGNISASYNAATGEMILTSAGATATLAQWQSALRSITYTDTAIMPNTATRTISFTAINGTGTTSDMVTRTVTVTATYQTPKVKTTGGTTAYTIGTSAVTIDSNVTVSDRDSTTMSSALVSIGTGFHSGDTLTFVNTSATLFGNIVGSYNAVNGVLTLTSSGATAALVQWSNALSAVWFSTAASSMPGIRTISFIVNDGTKISAAATDEVDVIGPAVPVVTTPANGSTTNDTTPVISGTAEPSHTITIVLDGAAAGTTTAAANGSWSWTPAAALTEGPHTVKVKSLDGAGNTSPDSNTSTFTVDTTPPAAPVVLRPANGYITNDATPMIGGTAEPGLTVTIVLDGTAAGSMVATATGTWSWKPASALAEGTHTVKAAAMDIAGNTSPDSNANTFTVDTTPPAAPVVVTPSNGSTMNVITPAISGTAEAGTTVTIVLDGAAAGTTTAVANGSWSWKPASALAKGPHTVKAAAMDIAGNTGPDSNTNTFTVDTTPPAAPVVVTPSNGSTTNHALPVLSGTAEAGATVTIVLDGAAAGTTAASVNGSWSWKPASALAEGLHTVKATAMDIAGNTGPESNTITFTIDTTPSAAPLVITPSNGFVTNNAMPVISGTAEAGAAVTIVLDGAAAGTTTAAANGSWSWTPASALAEGPHTAKATVTDTVGNTSPDSNTNTFTIDTAPPLAPVITVPVNGSTMNSPTLAISGMAEAGAAVTIVTDGAAAGTTTAAADGSWSWTPASALAEGPHTVKATAMDIAGNTSPDSNTITFTIDTTPSAAPIVVTPSNGFTTNNAMPDISGTAEADAAVTVVLDGAAAGTTTAAANGSWSWTPASALAEGPHTVKAMATDTVGNTSPDSNTIMFTIDTTAPVITLLGSNAISITEGDPFVDPGATAVDNMDGDLSAHITVTGTVYNQIPETYSLRYNVRDIAGNAALEAIRTVRVNPRIHTSGDDSGGDSSSGYYSGNADLKQLIVTANGIELPLSPAFAAGTAEYTIETDANQIEVRPIPSDAFASVAVQGEAAIGAKTVSLHEGDNQIEISVKAENGTIKTYALIVRRPPSAIHDTPSCSFSDIRGHWGESQICEAAANGIVEGDTPNAFRPNGLVSRVEFAAMLLRALGVSSGTEANELPFTDRADVPDWAKGTVGTAVERGILNGYSDGTLRPRQTISRSEAAAIVARAMKWEPMDSATTFTDDADIPVWAKGYVQSAARYGVLVGREGNRFAPDEQVTRAEAAVTLLRLRHRLK